MEFHKVTFNKNKIMKKLPVIQIKKNTQSFFKRVTRSFKQNMRVFSFSFNTLTDSFN